MSCQILTMVLLASLNRSRGGPFGHGSLFAKTLSKITDDQKALRYVSRPGTPSVPRGGPPLNCRPRLPSSRGGRPIRVLLEQERARKGRSLSDSLVGV